MYKVKVENGCRCFLKSGIPEVQDFSTQADAKEEAEALMRIMKSNFCQKHEFSLMEQISGYTIYIKERS